MKTEFTWKRGYFGPLLKMSEIEAELGADHVAYIRRQTHPFHFARSRASGAWMDNNPALYCAYAHLAMILEAESYGPEILEAEIRGQEVKNGLKN